MEINQQEEQIIKGVLKYFIYHLRISDVCNKVFTYYTSDFSQRLNRIKIYIYSFSSLQKPQKLLFSFHKIHMSIIIKLYHIFI